MYIIYNKNNRLGKKSFRIIVLFGLYYLYLDGFGIIESLNFKEHNSKFKLGKSVIFICFSYCQDE